MADGWFTNDDGTQLYQRINHGWWTFTPIPLRQRLRSFNQNAESVNSEAILDNRHRAMVYHHGSIITVSGHGPIENQSVQPFPNYNQAFFDSWRGEHFIEGEVQVLINNIISGQAVAVSDGSFRDQHGAAAWTIKGEDTSSHLRRAGITPGLPEDQSAYRSKLFGLWGILNALLRLTQDYTINSGLVVIACDSLSAFKKAKSPYPTNPEEAHYDLISAIRNMQALLPLKLTFEHVRGHQDQGIPMALSRLVCLNIQMDQAAKTKLLTKCLLDPMYKIPFEGWICTIEGCWKVKHMAEALQTHLNGKIILSHLAMKEYFSQKVAQTIDWESSDKAMKGLPLAQRQWVAKLATKFLPDGKNMQRWGFRSTAKCPQCECPLEDREHILKCPETWQNNSGTSHLQSSINGS